MKRTLITLLQSLIIILPIILVIYTFFNFKEYGYIISIDNNNKEILKQYFDDMNSKSGIKISLNFDNIKKIEYIEYFGDIDILKITNKDNHIEEIDLKKSYCKNITNYFKSNSYNRRYILIIGIILSTVISALTIDKINNTNYK